MGMKDRRKGKVHPSLSSPSSSPTSSSQKDPDSLLNFLPGAILALALSLPKPDREVLAYLIARSITVNQQHPKNKRKNPTTRSNKNSQKVPIFECGCFDCYTTFWLRWDSSPNRELIHQVIESFEEHLAHNHPPKKQNKGKEREKVAMVNKASNGLETAAPERTGNGETMPENAEGGDTAGGCGCGVISEEEKEGGAATGNLELEVAAVQCPVSNHKCLARKVLPDVVGLLNCRLWSLWSPGNI